MSSGFGGIVLRYFQHLFYLYLELSNYSPRSMLSPISSIYYSKQFLLFMHLFLLFHVCLPIHLIICGVSPLAALLGLTVFQKKITA